MYAKNAIIFFCPLPSLFIGDGLYPASFFMRESLVTLLSLVHVVDLFTFKHSILMIFHALIFFILADGSFVLVYDSYSSRNAYVIWKRKSGSSNSRTQVWPPHLPKLSNNSRNIPGGAQPQATLHHHPHLRQPARRLPPRGILHLRHSSNSKDGVQPAAIRMAISALRTNSSDCPIPMFARRLNSIHISVVAAVPVVGR